MTQPGHPEARRAFSEAAIRDSGRHAIRAPVIEAPPIFAYGPRDILDGTPASAPSACLKRVRHYRICSGRPDKAAWGATSVRDGG